MRDTSGSGLLLYCTTNGKHDTLVAQPPSTTRWSPLGSTDHRSVFNLGGIDTPRQSGYVDGEGLIMLYSGQRFRV